VVEIDMESWQKELKKWNSLNLKEKSLSEFMYS
jgi:hypothetical protein